MIGRCTVLRFHYNVIQNKIRNDKSNAALNFVVTFLILYRGMTGPVLVLCRFWVLFTSMEYSFSAVANHKSTCASFYVSDYHKPNAFRFDR